MTQPTAGSTVDSQVLVCYEVSSQARESVVVLEVTVLSEGTTIAGPVSLDGMVGRGSVGFEVTGAAAGPYDVLVQLIGDGAPIEGVLVTIPDVTIGDGAPPDACA